MKPVYIGSSEAKTKFAELIVKVRAGQVFVVTRRGKPVAQIAPLEQTARRPRFGAAKGRVHCGPDLDAPLPDLEEYMK